MTVDNQKPYDAAAYAMTLLEDELLIAVFGGNEETLNFWADSLKLFRDPHVDPATWQQYQSWTDQGIRRLMQTYGSSFGASQEDWKRRPKTEEEARENLAKLSTAIDYIRSLSTE